jgi:hypothetical protein
MTRFLQTGNGGLINADIIDTIADEKNQHGVWRAVATLRDGSRAALTGPVSRVAQGLLPVVAAEPGYSQLAYFTSEDGSFVNRQPIVAWRIEDDCAIPVTCETDSDAHNCVGAATLMPDGRVVWPYVQTFKDEAAWRKEMDAQAKARKAQKPQAVK